MKLYCPVCGAECKHEEVLEEFEEDFIQRYYTCIDCNIDYSYYNDRILDEVIIKTIK